MRSAADAITQQTHALPSFASRLWVKELMEPSAIA